MTVITTEQLQKDFPSVRALMDRGEVVSLEENGIPVATLTPRATGHGSAFREGKRILGGLEGQFKVPDDFDEMMRDEIEEMFYSKP